MKKVIIVVLFLLVCIGVAGGFWYYWTTHQVSKNQTAGKQELAQIVTKVGSHMELPTNETPTLVTVADVSKLHGEPFFAHAKNGFKVLIYTKAQKAILYDPFADKVVDVAPVNIGASQVKVTVTSTVTPTLTEIPSPRPTMSSK